MDPNFPFEMTSFAYTVMGHFYSIYVVGKVSQLPPELCKLLNIPPSRVYKLGRNSCQDELGIDDVTIVVNTFASRNIGPQKLECHEVFRKLIMDDKGAKNRTHKKKKKAEAFPPCDIPPIKCRDNLRYCRTLLMHHEGHNPILYVAFDDNPEDLDKAMWGTALDVKTRIHNPKAPQPNL